MTQNPTRPIDPLLSPPTPPTTLQFVDISYRIKLTGSSADAGGKIKRMLGAAPPPIKEKTILDGITGTAEAGELLAVLGPSGSGKSTLLKILAGRMAGSHGGTLLANGRSAGHSLSRRVGYVPQDDVLYPHLTVRETLTYCAMLRLRRTAAAAGSWRERAAAQVEAVVAELGLAACAETVVGGVFVRGVSGGERKRVAIGHEMLVNPSVVVVDEPTSGLDATAAGRMVATLAGMARRGGRAVVASVHQPASRVYGMFDAVLLLAEGKCLYSGRGRDAVDYFAGVGFAPGPYVNPADFMLDLANGVTQIDIQDDETKASVKQSLISFYNSILAPRAKSSVNASIAATLASSVDRRCPTSGDRGDVIRSGAKEFTRVSWLCQFSTLLHRSLKERRHETFDSLRVIQVVAAAFLAGSMWYRSSIRDVDDRLGLLFFISIFWGVFASFGAVFTFPQERLIFLKERASGMYSLSSYFMARTVGELPMELVLPAVFVAVLYWMVGLRPETRAFTATMAVILGYVPVAQGLGLAVGAAIIDAKKASTVVTVTMLAFLLTGGFYVEKVPSCMAWVKYISFTFYCYRLLIGAQYREGEMMAYLGKTMEVVEQVSVLMSVVALAVMFVGYRVIAYAALKRIKV
ncbi:ABC transporter G family member 25 [Apostasia shenzhenica]|uniref:ABC transporter G family member 25 n=1 Tax=Apostasia shenzhenica TaxID=1088818 RepID=A0A2H9ZUL8_9ASPA|nr:ABC transporter G family member 25 [Apostasia shenzhenica]